MSALYRCENKFPGKFERDTRYRENSHPGRQTHDPPGVSTDKHTVIACDGEQASLSCGKNVCFTFTIFIYPLQKCVFYSPVFFSLRKRRYWDHQVQLWASGQEQLHRPPFQHDLLYKRGLWPCGVKHVRICKWSNLSASWAAGLIFNPADSFFPSADAKASNRVRCQSIPTACHLLNTATTSPSTRTFPTSVRSDEPFLGVQVHLPWRWGFFSCLSKSNIVLK